MRRFISIILTIAFIIVSVTGLQLTFKIGLPTKENSPIAQQGQEISTTGNTKQETSFSPKKAHELAGFIFLGAGLVHIGLNRKPLLRYLKLR
ncbi:MAG: hypothetical protein H6Q74_2854 [Firmicutes bacterium]|nr:hypothetical protein [Bacillota bacterium]